MPEMANYSLYQLVPQNMLFKMISENFATYFQPSG